MFNEKALVLKLKLEEEMPMAEHPAGSKSKYSGTPPAESATTASNLDRSQDVLGRQQRRDPVNGVTMQARPDSQLMGRSADPKRFPGSRSET